MWRRCRFTASPLPGGPGRSPWAGPVSLATGIEHRSESVRGEASPTGWFLGNYVPTFGSYNVTEGFVETVVPLAQGVWWAKALDLNAAVRAMYAAEQ